MPGASGDEGGEGGEREVGDLLLEDPLLERREGEPAELADAPAETTAGSPGLTATSGPLDAAVPEPDRSLGVIETVRVCRALDRCLRAGQASAMNRALRLLRIAAALPGRGGVANPWHVNCASCGRSYHRQRQWTPPGWSGSQPHPSNYSP